MQCDDLQAAAWLASMHARLANLEGNVEPADAAQQRRQMITSAVSQQLPQEAESGMSNNNRLAVQPSQVSEWITTMRNRLNNIEQLMHNLERPHESITTENPNAQLQLDDADDQNSNAFLTELHADAAVASGSEQNPSPIAPAPELRGGSAHEAHVVRRSRRRREHGEEPSHVVAAAPEEEAEPAPHEDQLPSTRKRRRRLD